MKKEVLELKTAPKPVGAYSQLVRFGELLFSSGQIALEAKTNELISGGIEEQTSQVLDNIESLLQEGGSSFDQVLKMTIYLVSLKDFQRVNELYKRRFPGSFPVRSTVEVSCLPMDALIEIDFVASTA